ncbi:hypothetical protein ACLVWQ_17620 (plasmid) [Streptomyces sp. CWNU-52B]|uniref:hypothetical protein n=1 Tax=unclassified Streptomyces TaxID=2593676 RepID=UPI0039C076FB
MQTDRQQYIDEAKAAARKAGRLATLTENAARQAGRQDQVAPLAAAGALWADAARCYAAIAAVLPDTDETPADTTPEA